MKHSRQEKIIEIIESFDIETQDELLTKLAEAGFKATQATISRDIREMNLTKIVTPNGRQKYTLGNGKYNESKESYQQVLSSGILSIDSAENIIVIKTLSGVAMAVAAALDNIGINGVMGTIAGDDTIFLVVRTKELTMSVKAAMEKIVG